MSRQSDEFEHRIERIHNLIEQQDSQVVWNDRIPDPDNPTQLRQIDISIRRDNSLTLVECRLHNEPQDVKWVEELIGRRQSLQADAVMAVSASGFTKGAVAKAHAFNVTLRDIRTLTEEEVRLWGHKTRAWLTFYRFTDINLNFVFDEGRRRQAAREHVINYIATSDLLGIILSSVTSNLHPNKDHNLLKPGRVEARVHLENPTICNAKILDLHIISEIQFLEIEVDIPIVSVFGDPRLPSKDRKIFIEQINRGETEVIQAVDKVSVSVDLSDIKPPNNSILRAIKFDFGRGVTIESYQIVKMPCFLITVSDVLVSLSYRPRR